MAESFYKKGLRMTQHEEHKICFINVTALLVSDRLYAHTLERGSENARNGRLVGKLTCIGVTGRLEAIFTLLSKNRDYAKWFQSRVFWLTVWYG